MTSPIHNKVLEEDGKQQQQQQKEKKEVHTVRKDVIDLLAKRVMDVVLSNVEKPIEQVLENLPKDTKQIRQLPFYNMTLESLQWQRDNYLVGNQYANQRKKERPFNIGPPPVNQIPFNPDTLGNIQIINLGSWFIPSPTVKDALLPLIVSLPLGTLKEPITNAVVNAIPLAQPVLDRAVKNSILDFMQNPYWREVIKNRTRGYIGDRK